MKAKEVAANAVVLRDECFEAMLEWEEEGEDPGDARVTIKGNRKNALDVLYILNAIGVPGCSP